MAPDLNSLPPSRSPASPSPFPSPGMTMTRPTRNPNPNPAEASSSALRGQSPSPSPRSGSTSLQAAAAVNAGLQHEDSRRSPASSTRNQQTPSTGRRRSTVLMNLQLNDPNLPAPGEMVHEPHQASHRTASPQSLAGSPIIPTGDPHHRAPSLGEIHQELEQEQEAQVNRLLQMIRSQQQQLQQLQAASGQAQSMPQAIDESTPTSERSMSFSNNAVPLPHSSSFSTPRSPSAAPHPRSSFDLARSDIAHRRSRTPSRNASPSMRATSVSGETGENLGLGARDESAFYQAETQMMVRENQMLRQRIRELERQVNVLHANSSITHEPTTPSHLLRSTSVTDATAPAAPPPENKED